MFFSAGGRPRNRRKTGRLNEYSYHIEVRTLNARRMFREQKRKKQHNFIAPSTHCAQDSVKSLLMGVSNKAAAAKSVPQSLSTELTLLVPAILQEGRIQLEERVILPKSTKLRQWAEALSIDEFLVDP